MRPTVYEGEHRFRAAWWLPGPQLQTLWPVLMRREPHCAIRHERFPTVDGDFVDLDWCGEPPSPIVILLHGLTGSSRSSYIAGLLRAFAKLGWRSIAMNFRGCGGRPNDTARCYHSGETGDLDDLYRRLRRREPTTPMAAVGFSLGGNMLLKWLGESAGDVVLFAASAVSVPFRLDLCASRMDRGFSRIYRNQLLRELKCYITEKRVHLANTGNHREAQKLMDLGDLSGIRSFWEYDDRVVARLYGFRDARDYYDRSSSRQFLRLIRVPTLLIHADDDPFMPPETVPERDELSPSVRLELTRGGGHVGFVAGSCPGKADYWLDRRIPAFLSAELARHSDRSGRER